MVRSPHPHARIVRIDTAPAQGDAGRARRVRPARTALADGLKPIPHSAGAVDQIRHEARPRRRRRRCSSDRTCCCRPTRPATSAKPWRWWWPRPARRRWTPPRRSRSNTRSCRSSSHSEDALKPGAPAVWDEAPDNVLVDTQFGDKAKTDRAFAAADHVVKTEFNIGRVTAVPMELRSALGHYDRGDAALHALRRRRRRGEAEAELAERARRRARQGARAVVTTSAAISARATGPMSSSAWCCGPSKKLGRPVKYTATRSEAFLTDYQGRDLVTKVELALRKDGKIPGDARRQHQQRRRALRVAVAAQQGLGADHRLLRHSSGDAARPRRVHQHHADQRLSQLGPAGGDLRDRAADRSWPPTSSASTASRLRRKNLVPPKTMPYRNAVGMLYDSGTYEANMDLAHARSPTSRASSSASARRRSAASCWASASRTTSSPRSARHASAPRSR